MTQDAAFPNRAFPNRAASFWIAARETGELRRGPLAAPAPGAVRVRTLFSGVSRGTETLVWRGLVPASQYEAMRAPFQEGDFPYPVKYGYSAVGTVQQGPAGLIGRPVFCLHPHQDLFDVPADAAHPLPDGLPPGRAVLAANMETALNACWDAAPLAGERIAVIGAGVVGCLTGRLMAQVPGTAVQLIDVNPDKRAIADALGLDFSAPEAAVDGCDLVVHASGDPAGLETALALAGLEGRIVELSWYGDRRVALPLGEAFHSGRLTLISSQVGRLPAHRRARWDHRRRMALALDLLCDPVYDALITGEDAFEDLPAAMARLADDPSTLCHRLRYAAPPES